MRDLHAKGAQASQGSVATHPFHCLLEILAPENNPSGAQEAFASKRGL